MPDEIKQYRSAVKDALGRVIPDEGELRVWLDDDERGNPAPEDWTHLISDRELAFLSLSGRVVEISRGDHSESSPVADEWGDGQFDAAGNPIPRDGELRVWLDDDLTNRKAPEGWIHLVTAREVAFLLLTGRVIELSLDNDLNGDKRNGLGHQVVDFIVDQQGSFNNLLWPRDGISIHTANPEERDAMLRAIEAAASLNYELEVTTPGGQPHVDFTPRA